MREGRLSLDEIKVENSKCSSDVVGIQTGKKNTENGF